MNRLREDPEVSSAALAAVGTRPLDLAVPPGPDRAQDRCSRCRQLGLDGCTEPGGWQCSRCRVAGCPCDHSRCEDGMVEVVAGQHVPGSTRLAARDGVARCPSCTQAGRKGPGIIRPGGRVT